MPTVRLTLTDTPTGGVAVHSDFEPAVGNACSPAQAAALEIFNRTRRDWGMSQTPTDANNAVQQQMEQVR